MKTIEQAAKEYYTDTVNYPKGVDSIGAKSIAYRSFNAGVEFAEQWISVDEELPQEKNQILMKRGNSLVTTGFYGCTIECGELGFYRNNEPYSLFLRVTHWRPIERK